MSKPLSNITRISAGRYIHIETDEDRTIKLRKSEAIKLVDEIVWLLDDIYEPMQ